ncbi:MAG: glycosyltransferase [Janthinobacterium lividum]
MTRRTWLKAATAATAATLACGLARPAVARSFPKQRFDDAGKLVTHRIAQLHQILIVDGYGMPVSLPADIARRMTELKALYPGAEHTLWTGDMLRDFIAHHFDRSVLGAFDSLKAYSCKCDLGRLCLLYVKGGLYGDIMLEHYKGWKIPDGYGFAAFRQPWTFRPYTGSVSTSLLWSRPARDELMIAIKTIVEHCRARFYGIDRIEPTGCWSLGRACAAAATDRWRGGWDDDQYMGVHRAAGLDGDMIFHTSEPDNEAIACRTARAPGDWTATGLGGTNNYAAMWAARDLYK